MSYSLIEDKMSRDSFPLWGEIVEDRTSFVDNWSKDLLNNMDQQIILDSIQPVSYKTKLYFMNVTPVTNSSNKIKITDPIKRAVSLIKRRDDLRELINTETLADDSNDTISCHASNSISCHASNSEPVTISSKKSFFHSDNSSDFMNGVYSHPVVALSPSSALDVLQSCVQTILAFAGFSETTAIPSQLLTEITEEYIKKIIFLLQRNVEKEKLSGETGFSDVLDRTCHELGIGSIRNLMNYYEEMLDSYRKKVEQHQREIKQCESALNKLREEKCQTKEVSSTELDDINFIVPELHVTSMYSAEVASESFEVGLKMLQTLESQELSSSLARSSNCMDDSDHISADFSVTTNGNNEDQQFKKKRK